MKQVVLCMMAAAIGALLTLSIADQSQHSAGQLAAQGLAQRPLTVPRATSPRRPAAAERPALVEGLTPDEAVNIKVYEQSNRSVVNISTLSVRPDGFFMLAVPEEGSGSGSVLDKEGHILTNYHVIQDARRVTVTLYDEESYPATLVGADPLNDMAVIRIDAPPEKLVPVTLGDSDSLRVGMRVFALGNPFGLNRTLSTGIVSSLNRSLEIHENWIIKSIIQIDAAINPGNSGGPLLDSRGRLIGINTAIASNTGQSAGVGFAIPINLAKRVVPELIAHGRVIRGEIGITHVTETDEGLRIARMTRGGPAEQAGLQGPQIVRRRQGPFRVERIDRSAADVIVAIDEQPVSTAADFLGFIESKKPGDVLTLTVKRGEETLKIDVTLGGGEVDDPNAVGPNSPI